MLPLIFKFRNFLFGVVETYQLYDFSHFHWCIDPAYSWRSSEQGIIFDFHSVELSHIMQRLRFFNIIRTCWIIFYYFQSVKCL